MRSAFLIGQTEFLVDAHPVLEGDETEHRGRGEMPAHDVLGQPARQGVWCCTTTAQGCVVVGLCALFILIPPLTQRSHIVGRDGVDRTVGIMRQLSETDRIILWHRLDLE